MGQLHTKQKTNTITIDRSLSIRKMDDLRRNSRYDYLEKRETKELALLKIQEEKKASSILGQTPSSSSSLIKDARSLVELKQIEKPFLVSTAGNDGANMTPPANNNDTSTRPSDELVWEESQSKKSRIQTKEYGYASFV